MKVTIRAGQPAIVDVFELLNDCQSFRRKGLPPIEGMQHDALQQIAEAHVLVLSQRFQHLEQRGRDTDACLCSLHHHGT